jgi:dTMP kinase
MSKRGLLIVFEGLDRVGKSSQVKLLQNSLELITGNMVFNQRFPDRDTTSGKELNSLLSNQKELNIKASHLLFSFNRWEKMDDMKNKLLNGQSIIVDRYAFSGVSYSIANNCNKDYALVPDKGLLRPDIVIQLDMEIDEIKNRDGFGEEKYEKEEIQRKVQDAFKLFSKKIYWRKINANRSREEIHNEIVEIVKELISKLESKSFDIKQANGYPTSINEDLFTEDDI